MTGQAEKDSPPDVKSNAAAPGHRPRRRFGVLLPFAVFACLAALFFFGLKAGDPSKLPSALIGKPVPAFDLPPLETADSGSGPNLTSAALGKGTPAIVHFFASWCGPCREEHPVVMALADTLRAENPGVPFYGINYKDDASAARRFLGGYGDPYTQIGVDRSGRTAIDFGVYGVPETYVVAGDGTIAFRQAGPLTQEVIEAKILPLLRGKPARAEVGNEADGKAAEPSG